jgi:hypothetical protein
VLISSPDLAGVDPGAGAGAQRLVHARGEPATLVALLVAALLAFLPLPLGLALEQIAVGLGQLGDQLGRVAHPWSW